MAVAFGQLCRVGKEVYVNHVMTPTKCTGHWHEMLCSNVGGGRVVHILWIWSDSMQSLETFEVSTTGLLKVKDKTWS